MYPPEWPILNRTTISSISDNVEELDLSYATLGMQTKVLSVDN